MKPSEFFLKERINNQKWFDEYDSERHAILDLDKRFIDREELKNKINNIDIWHKNGLQLKKEILELIK